MPEGTYQKGLDGENRAIAYLQARGMVLLWQRYRSPFGEIDAVMRDGETLVFVEVKARNRAGAGSGLLSVTAGKRRKLVRTGLAYLSEHGCDSPVRFDVVELTSDGVNHVEDAFPGSEF